jgi:transcriptional regulator with XRE-family HTH domain
MVENKRKITLKPKVVEVPDLQDVAAVDPIDVAVVQFGLQVRDRRKQEKLSQGDLAEQVEISRNYLSQIERGEATNLSWKVRQRLCEVLGLAVESSTELQGLPESLLACATRLKLPSDDVQMLANLKYRGKQPDTPEKWEMLYNVIKLTIGK